MTKKLMDVADASRRRPSGFGAGRRLRPAGPERVGRRPRHRIDGRAKSPPQYPRKTSLDSVPARPAHPGTPIWPRTRKPTSRSSPSNARSRNWNDRQAARGRQGAVEESVAIYERGEALKRRCEELLRQAEARVDKITTDATAGDGRAARRAVSGPRHGVMPCGSPACGQPIFGRMRERRWPISPLSIFLFFFERVFFLRFSYVF